MRSSSARSQPPLKPTLEQRTPSSHSSSSGTKCKSCEAPTPPKSPSNDSFDGSQRIITEAERRRIEKAKAEEKARQILIKMRAEPIKTFEDAELERRVKHFIGQQYHKIKLKQPKTPRDHTAYTFVPNQEIQDVERIIRNCFSTKSHKIDCMLIDEEVTKIQGHNEEVIQTVNQIQENLEFMDEGPDRHVHHDDIQFNREIIMRDQKRSRKENYENFLKLKTDGEQLDDRIKNHKRMRMLVGSTSKLWKPNKLNLSRSMMSILNSKSANQDRPQLDPKSRELAMKKATEYGGQSVHERLYRK